MKKDLFSVLSLLLILAMTCNYHSASGNESVEEFIDEDGSVQSEYTQSPSAEEMPVLEDVEIVETISNYVPGSNQDVVFSERAPDTIEHVIRIDEHSKAREGETKNSFQDVKASGEKKASRPELGSTANKIRKVLHHNVPTLRKKKKSNPLIADAENLTGKHIEPMIESHQALNRSNALDSQALLMNVNIEEQ
ncbi:MAG: hypothetical protein ACTHJ4_01610 [Candidatus Nucleicultricaceae bacterium]